MTAELRFGPTASTRIFELDSVHIADRNNKVKVFDISVGVRLEQQLIHTSTCNAGVLHKENTRAAAIVKKFEQCLSLPVRHAV